MSTHDDPVHRAAGQTLYALEQSSGVGASSEAGTWLLNWFENGWTREAEDSPSERRADLIRSNDGPALVRDLCRMIRRCPALGRALKELTDARAQIHSYRGVELLEEPECFGPLALRGIELTMSELLTRLCNSDPPDSKG